MSSHLAAGRRCHIILRGPPPSLQAGRGARLTDRATREGAHQGAGRLDGRDGAGPRRGGRGGGRGGRRPRSSLEVVAEHVRAAAASALSFRRTSHTPSHLLFPPLPTQTPRASSPGGVWVPSAFIPGARTCAPPPAAPESPRAGLGLIANHPQQVRAAASDDARLRSGARLVSHAGDARGRQHVRDVRAHVDDGPHAPLGGALGDDGDRPGSRTPPPRQEARPCRRHPRLLCELQKRTLPRGCR
jgi:hypothetical protein